MSLAKILTSLVMMGISWLAFRWLSAQQQKRAAPKPTVRSRPEDTPVQRSENRNSRADDPDIITMHRDPETGAYRSDSDRSDR
ncbi:MAG: hypothetical protein AAF354_13685 [Pseudomonadota bacterium]